MRRVNPSFHKLTSYNPWQILSVGYNGFPPGTPNEDKYWNKEAKHDFVVHAEANAVLLAGQADLEGSIAFVTMFPCLECAKMLIAVSDIENIDIAYIVKPVWNRAHKRENLHLETCIKRLA